ncbi:MAG: hypothetical protein M5U28_25370 [Sandaracinaceae bacterium]|nr:hypothetical protein [Sandaracinaceae bacterium]
MSAPVETARGLASLGRVGVFSTGIARIPHLGALLGAERVVFRPGPLRRVDCVVGWGRKPNTRAARRYAARHGVPFVALEDGFLRSVGLGVDGDPPLSIVVDDVGIYYDATQPSRLERALAEDPLDDPAQLARARACIDRIREAKLSKYNAAPALALEPSARRRVLVVDQTAGDLSVRLGLCAPGAFDAMLAAALDEHPGAEILVKTHPDVARGARRGCFSELRPSDRVRVLAEPIHPIALLEQVEHVYVATSLLGFEALLVGRPVTCFGAPFYAGWGATDDRARVPARRGRALGVEQIFAAAYLQYARYVDPETGARCELERVIEHLALQRRMLERTPGRTVCVGFSLWKRGFVPAFLGSPPGEARFARSARAAERLVAGRSDARILVWGSREREELRRGGRARGRADLEDGGRLPALGRARVRSLRARLARRRSARHLLRPEPAERARAHPPRGRLLEREPGSGARAPRAHRPRGISKYNQGVAAKVGPSEREGRDVALVVGQVEDDASIALGTLDVRRNEALLRAARDARPHAYLIYKPHPDVVSGNREDSLPLDRARAICDEVVVDASLADCLRVATEVHTMTSLVGFEALLRGLSVHVYGQPFYAGWGLTNDRHPHPRRTRRLELDELVCGALIRYPRYVHPVSGRFTTPESIVEHLAVARVRAPTRWERSWPARQARKIRNLARGVLRAS